MKRKIKKILRYFLIFLSVICLCGCLCATAFADHVTDGSSYVFTDVSRQSDSVILDWAILQAEARGYDCSGRAEDWAQDLIDYLESLGVDVGQASGYYVPGGHGGGNSTHGSLSANTLQDYEINYNDNDIISFLNDLKDFDITAVTDSSSAKDKFYKSLLWPFYTTMDTQAIEDYLARINSYSARGADNLKNYFKFKNFGLARGGYTGISGSVLNPDYFHPTQIDLRFGTSYPTGQTAADYSVPVDGSEVFSQGIGNNGFVEVNWSVGVCDFEVTSLNYSEVNCYITLYGCEYGDQFSIVNTDLYSNQFRIESSVNCSVSSSGVVTVTSSYNNFCQIYVRWYGDYHGTGNEYHFDLKYNVLSGGVTAPSQPIYKMPDPSDPNYETEKKQYDYFLTETDRLLDEYDINSFMEDVRNTFDDTPWLFYPIEFYNQVATVLTDNYSSTFDFTLEEMNFSSIADGFIIPHKEFHFDPNTLPAAVKSLFRLFQWILTFSYFWALIMWGRSLILRFGSDSTHIDYEDN